MEKLNKISGGWDIDKLIAKLQIAKTRGAKTVLITSDACLELSYEEPKKVEKELQSNLKLL